MYVYVTEGILRDPHRNLQGTKQPEAYMPHQISGSEWYPGLALALANSVSSGWLGTYALMSSPIVLGAKCPPRTPRGLRDGVQPSLYFPVYACILAAVNTVMGVMLYSFTAVAI